MLARIAEKTQYAWPPSVLDATGKEPGRVQPVSLTRSTNKHNQHERNVARKVSIRSPLGAPNSLKTARDSFHPRTSVFKDISPGTGTQRQQSGFMGA